MQVDREKPRILEETAGCDRIGEPLPQKHKMGTGKPQIPRSFLRLLPTSVILWYGPNRGKPDLIGANRG